MLVAELGKPSRVVSGGAKGADALAKRWAVEQKVECKEHLPKSHAREAFLARNTLIVQDSDVVVAFLAKESRGTRDTITNAKKLGKRVVVIDV